MPTHPNLSLNAGPSQLGKSERPSASGRRKNPPFPALDRMCTVLFPHLSLNSQPALHISTPQTPAAASMSSRRSVRFAAVESYLRARSQRKFRSIPSLHMNHVQSPNLKSCCLLPDPRISSHLMSRQSGDCPSKTVTHGCPRAMTCHFLSRISLLWFAVGTTSHLL